MKLFLSAALMLLMVSCRHDERIVTPSPTSNPTYNPVTPPDVRQQYHGRFKVEIYEMLSTGYPPHSTNFFDTTYTCIVKISSQVTDSVVFGVPSGTFRFPTVTLTKDDGSKFWYAHGGEIYAPRMGVDSNGNLVRSMAPWDRNVGGFITKDSINYRFYDEDPKTSTEIKIKGSRI